MKSMRSINTTTITVSRENKDRLAKFGCSLDSLDDCLSCVLDIAIAEREKREATKRD